MTSPEKVIAVMQSGMNLQMQERNISVHFVLFLSFFFLWMATKAQDNKIWTLEDCINYALDNNISIKKQDLLIKTQEELLLQSKLGILPNLNGYASHGYNWGQRVDPFTNDFATDRVRSNNLYLQGDLNLFSGLQQLNLIKRNMLNMQSAQLDADYYRDEIAVTVATQYLQTLFYIEFVAIAKNQIDITRQQVDRTRKLVDAGTLAKGDLLTIEAQLASEELAIVEAENNLSLSYLNLTQLLEIPTPKGFEIERPELGLLDQPEILTPEQIFGVAVQERPEIQSAEIKLESSERTLSLARGAYYPSLSLSGSLGSGYSGANVIGENPYYGDPQEIGFTASGEKVYVPNLKYETSNAKPWEDQLEDNLNKSLAFNLRIPIFNGWSSRSNVAQAKIGIENSTLDLQLQKNTLYKIIQQAYNDAVAASNKHKAADKKVNATKESFNYAEQRFNVGLINSVDYNNAKKEYNNALSELIQAKYDFVFRMTVIDFYLGKPLSLKR